MKGALQGEAAAPVVVYGGGPISWRTGALRDIRGKILI